MTEVVAVEASNYLADLAARIRQEHDAVGHALKRGLEHAINAGNLLLEAKAQLKQQGGAWLPWLSEHCQVSERMAPRYMQLARHAPWLEANPTRVSDLSVRGALALLAVPRRQSDERLSGLWVDLADEVADVGCDFLELDWTEERIAERASQQLIAEAMAAVEKIGELATTRELVEIIDRESEDFCARVVAGSSEYRSAQLIEMGLTEAEYDEFRAQIDALKARGLDQWQIASALVGKIPFGEGRPANPSPTAVATKVRDIVNEWLCHVEQFAARAVPAQTDA
jgi:Protein of unknown function (DUF3102)